MAVSLVIDDDKKRKKFMRWLVIYRSFLFKFTKTKISSTYDDVIEISLALNKKKRKERIIYIYDSGYSIINEFYKGKNMCKFIDNKCLSHVKNNKNKLDGCCRSCKYKSGGECPTQNIACKLFYCGVVKEQNDVILFDDIPVFKVLSPLQRFILKSDYFSTREDVINDLYYGVILAPFRIMYRLISFHVFGKHKNRK